MTATFPVTFMSPAQREELETPTLAPDLQVLTRAAELLITDGWCQGCSLDDSGRFCLAAALSEATRELYPTTWVVVYRETIELVHDTLALRGWHDLVENWNDQPGRSLDDVLDVIAAARVLGGGAL